MKIAKAKLLLDSKCTLGEGPVWDWKKESLYWVDIEGQKMHRYCPSDRKRIDWGFGGMLGAAVPMENGTMLLALEKGLAAFNPQNGTLTELQVLENTYKNIRFNDGKVGPEGNLWVGTMDKEGAVELGNFYRVDPNLQVSLQISKTSISNGMAWSADKKTFYYIDSPTFEVRAFDFDVEKSGISNGKAIIKVPQEYGSPDGMCIDYEGMLWIAHWGGNCVRRWNPKTGKVLQKVAVDAPHVTSCCFGGKNLDTLYITTARSGLSVNQLKEYPKSGGLFVYKPDIKGTPITYFKMN